MAPKFDMVSDVSPSQEAWTLLVRVIRLWRVADFTDPTKPFSIELVLMDSKGDRIHATLKKTLLYRFETQLKEGAPYVMSNFGVAANVGPYRTTRHDYKLSFQYGTKVKEVFNDIVPKNVFNFGSPAEVLTTEYDTNYLVDIMGVLTGVGKEIAYEKNGEKIKLVSIELDTNGFRFKLTLFGNYVDDLNSFLASGDSNNAVMIILFAKVKQFNGKPVIQNSIGATKLMFNPDITEASAMKERMLINSASPNQGLTQLQESSEISIVEGLLKLTPRTTIEKLRECREESVFVVMATIKHICDEDGWWYTACSCNKKVYPDEKMYFCEKCNRHVLQVTPRYRIKLRVINHTDSLTMVLFDRDASALLKKSCAELVESMVTPGSPIIPNEILNLIDKTFLFKIEVNSNKGTRYEPSFRVKRFSNDAKALELFKATNIQEKTLPIVAELHSANGIIVGTMAHNTVAQDLMNKFTESNANDGKVVVEAETESGGGKADEGGNHLKVTEVVDLSRDSQEFTTPKRSSPDGDFDPTTSAVVKQLKREIKIEKD